MILVFGGTTEGKIAVRTLEKSGLDYIYSTKTNIDFQTGAHGSYRYGAFTTETLIQFCKAQHIRYIIHASHPFAENLHQTIFQASQHLGLPVYRFERQYPDRILHSLIHYFPSYATALAFLIKHPVTNLLALTGVQTITKFEPYWLQHPTVFRILPRDSSLSIARDAGFPEERLIQEMPGNDLQHELDLIRQHHISGMLTKESGDSGFLSTKIMAAIQAEIPILIIERPTLPDTFVLVYHGEDLLAHLSTQLL